MLPLQDVLDDVALPLTSLGRFGSAHALQLAAAIWNIARLPDTYPHQMLLRAVASSTDSDLDADLAGAISRAYRLAASIHGDDHRVVDALPAGCG
jgi:hypothetical protein